MSACDVPFCPFSGMLEKQWSIWCCSSQRRQATSGWLLQHLSLSRAFLAWCLPMTSADACHATNCTVCQLLLLQVEVTAPVHSVADIGHNIPDNPAGPLFCCVHSKPVKMSENGPQFQSDDLKSHLNPMILNPEQAPTALRQCMQCFSKSSDACSNPRHTPTQTQRLRSNWSNSNNFRICDCLHQTFPFCRRTQLWIQTEKANKM